jgi:HAE1 family hydrophobic/amphiphilic exporter-1
MLKMFIRRPVLSIVVSLIIVFIGTLSLFNLPITQYPSISPPKVNVVADYPGANNELLIKSVVIPLETGAEWCARHEIYRIGCRKRR